MFQKIDSMIIYVEKAAKNYELTEHILVKFPNSTIIEIDNYKNIFDKNINYQTEKCLILAKLNSNWITEVPANYSKYKKAFFFKTSLNCPFNCSYCYLNWAFKNNFQVIFVNYDDIMESIENKIKEVRNSWFKDTIMFYASDYSDTLAIENLTQFHLNFISFFEKFPNIIMESRTKSVNIDSLNKLWFVPKNTEIAFSLNPEELINKYEKLTPSLDSRIDAINELLSWGFRVWLRFLPLLPVNNYLAIYSTFLDYVITKIDLSKVNSIEIWGLLYTKEDYMKILKKDVWSDFLYRLDDEDWEFIRSPREFRNNIYNLFFEKLNKFNICLDNYEK